MDARAGGAPTAAEPVHLSAEASAEASAEFDDSVARSREYALGALRTLIERAQGQLSLLERGLGPTDARLAADAGYADTLMVEYRAKAELLAQMRAASR